VQSQKGISDLYQKPEGEIDPAAPPPPVNSAYAYATTSLGVMYNVQSRERPFITDATTLKSCMQQLTTERTSWQ